MKMIVGIGNPGRDYAGTRHNVGFMVLDAFAESHGIRPWRKRFQSLAAEGAAAGAKALLLKPQTYMNESGQAVRAAVEWRAVPAQDVMVVCDDFNLVLGRLRVRARGSSGGHHGLDSIAAHLGTAGFPRLRIGIGSEGASRDRDFVLSTFSAAERAVVEEAVRRAVRALDVWLEFGLARCQNEFNARPDETPGEEADA